MNVSRESNIYKLAMLCRKTEPKSLCPFFWSCVASIAMVFAMIALVTLGVGITTVPFWGWLFAPFGQDDPIMGFMILGGVLDTIAVIWFGLNYLSNTRWFRDIVSKREIKAHERWEKKRERERAKPKQPSVIKEYAKAVKNKVCPMMSYED